MLVAAPVGAPEPTHLAAYESRDDGPQSPLTLRTLLPAPADARGIARDDGACRPDTEPPGRRLFLPGDALPLDDYAAFRADGERAPAPAQGARAPNPVAT